MAAGTQSHVAATPDVEPRDRPEISVCEGAPGTSVFLESGNTDGWIASDATVDVTR
ncbi:hypothetical protein [Halosimplex pelagicum]|uniref:Uncharacterized protein n=1 Tax=Halosimplex pelagicum TaxID=869886 RepID=A0A7D5PEC7_9EURY|nr:hypothetical protein [Halosimplex pelagicum]QLH81399.1 hypothetical protein HZS54_07055 [Halosimplex pelagicum]